MLLTIFLWCIGVGAALLVLWFLFGLVMMVVAGYAEYGLKGAIWHAIAFLGISCVMLFLKVLGIVFSVAVFIFMVWIFSVVLQSCSGS